MKHTKLLISLIAALGITFASQAQAQVQTPSGYPNKTIRMILPLAVGSAVDVAARLLAQKMSANMGQSIVIENVTGAAGIIGADKLAKAAPDGYTIGGFNDSVVTMVPNLNPNTPYNPINDFTYITQAAIIDFTAAVPMDSPFKTIADLVAAAKASPGRINYASPGVGTPHHLSMELFKNTAQVFLTHIPYRGTAPAVSDLLGGQVEAMFLPIHVALPQIKAGKLVALGIGSDQRHPLLPNVPTLAEAKTGKVNVDMWYGIFAPKNTPNDIVQAFNREIKTILASEDVQKAFQPQGMDPANSTPEEFGKLVERDANRWAELIKIQNIKAE